MFTLFMWAEESKPLLKRMTDFVSDMNLALAPLNVGVMT